MNLIRRSLIFPTLLRRHVVISTQLQAYTKSCPPNKTNEDYEQLVVGPEFKKIKEKQKKFQVDDGLPVWLKGGFVDKLLLQATLVGLTICLIMSGPVLYELIMRGFQ